MDEQSRLASDVSQLTRRLDDLSLRVGTWEAKQVSLEGKIDRMAEIIDLKMTMLGNNIGLWNKLGTIIVTAVFGAVAVAIVAFVVSGGLRPSPQTAALTGPAMVLYDRRHGHPADDFALASL